MKTLILSIVALVSIISSLNAAILAGPITNAGNNHAYFLLTLNRWGPAEREAVSLGGHLATINDTNENQFVLTNFSSIAGPNGILWIGLTDGDGEIDRGVEGTFRWISGETSTFRNWAGTESNNANGGEDRVGMWPSGAGAGFWNDFTGPTQGFGVVEIVPGIATQVGVHPAVEIAWPTQTTNRYQIQWCSALKTNNWFNLADPIHGTGGTNYYFDSARDTDQRFYRVLTLRP